MIAKDGDEQKTKELLLLQQMFFPTDEFSLKVRVRTWIQLREMPVWIQSFLKTTS
jgi:hypothetical protein